MNRKLGLTITGWIAVAVALVYVTLVMLFEFDLLPYDATEAKLFVPGYLFLPLPIVGFAAGILLQIFSVHSGKRRDR
jgi:hypothetical protein